LTKRLIDLCIIIFLLIFGCHVGWW